MYDGITWGQATNGLQLGIAKTVPAPANHNQALRCYVIVYLGVQPNSTFHAGLLPVPKGYRLSFSLTDPKGNKIARTNKGESHCKAVTALVRVQLQAARKGINLPPGRPYEYDNFSVPECFSVVKPGNYTLEIRANCFAVASYPNIAQIPLPPVRVPIEMLDADLDQ